MTRIKILVEGMSELRFVQQTLTPWFGSREIFLEPFQTTTSRERSKGRTSRGGGRSYAQIRNELQRQIATEGHKTDVWYSSMIDLYALPADFPGRDGAQALDGQSRVLALEASFASDIQHRRFIPYLQLHEFEALLFADIQLLGNVLQAPDQAISALQSDVAGRDPEAVNETPQGAPSKRIVHRLPAYERRKTAAGPSAAGRIGLDVLRTACPHFGAWLDQLEHAG